MIHLCVQNLSERQWIFAIADAGVADAVAPLMDRKKKSNSKTVTGLMECRGHERDSCSRGRQPGLGALPCHHLLHKTFRHQDF